MSRDIRTAIPLLPHHVTQRGVRRQDVFFTPGDRSVYLDLLTLYAQRYGVELLAYTLMTNHVHHLAVPHERDSLRWTFQMTHKRYAEYINARNKWTGHLWQAKFFSSPVDPRARMASASQAKRISLSGSTRVPIRSTSRDCERVHVVICRQAPKSF